MEYASCVDEFCRRVTDLEFYRPVDKASNAASRGKSRQYRFKEKLCRSCSSIMNFRRREERARQGPAIELERVDGTVLHIFDGAQRQTLIGVLAALAGVTS